MERQTEKSKITFVNIIFFAIFGVLTGVLWAYACPIPLIPGAVHFRTFAFLITAIGFLFGPVTGFFSGYIGTLVWALLSGNFIPLHSPLTDGITVGLSAALPALIMLRGGKNLDDLVKNKGKFIATSMFWSILFGVAMILTTSLSLSYFTGLGYGYCVLWIGIADVVPIALTPFVVLLLQPRLKKVQTLIPRI